MRKSLELLNPRHELSSLQKGIDRLFDEFMSPLVPPSAMFWKEGYESFRPACDLTEADDHYLVTFDLPGISADDVKIEVIDNQLIVSGERKEETVSEGKGSPHFAERFYGKFHRVFTLPHTVEADKVEADYKDGVLRIAVPKTEASKGKVIRIGEAKRAGLLTRLTSGKKEKEKTEVA